MVAAPSRARLVSRGKCPADFSLLDPAVQECPYPAYEVYRDHPVFQMPETGHFVVSRYEDIYQIVRTPEVYSMDTLQDGGHPYDNNPEIRKLFSERGWESRTVLSADPPLHGTYRKLLEHCFTNQRMKALQPQVETWANALVDNFIGQGEVEFIEHFCYPLPMLVITRSSSTTSVTSVLTAPTGPLFSTSMV